MPTEEYKEARKKLWGALGFEPNKNDDGTLKEGDLYKVPKVIFEDDTPPKALLKRMLGKQPPVKETPVLNAILGDNNVLGLSYISKDDSKFNKIWKALGAAGAREGAICFLNTMAKDHEDPAKNKIREDFKLLLKEYLEKATTRTFNANGRDPYRGDRILCCLLLLHYMTKDITKLDAEITYYPGFLANSLVFLLQEASTLYTTCNQSGLAGVNDYFKKFHKDKLTYYDVVLPKAWDKKQTSDFDRIKKMKNTFKELSIQYNDIVSGVNIVSTPEDRLKITKFFVAAFQSSRPGINVFAERDNVTLNTIRKNLFPNISDVASIQSAPNKEQISAETVNGLVASVKKLAGILVFPFSDGQPSADHAELLQENMGFLIGRNLYDDNGDGKTYLRLLRDYEKIIEQMTMLKSLSPEQRTTFLDANVASIKGMLYGNPLNRTQVDELKKRNREANVAKIADFAKSDNGEIAMDAKITSTGQELKQAQNDFDFMDHAARFCSMVERNENHYYWLLTGQLGQNHAWTKDEQDLWNFAVRLGCSNNIAWFMATLRSYSNTRNPDGTIVFHNQEIKGQYDKICKNGQKLTDKSKRLQSQKASLQALKDAINNNNADYDKDVLPKFKECILAFYDFSGDDEERWEESKVLKELMYDTRTGELSQMMKDLAKGAKKVKTVTGAELRRKAAKATPSRYNTDCAKYVTMVVNNPMLKLNDTTQKFIPGNETLKRCTEVLRDNGLNSDDVLHIFGTASQSNGCESQDTEHATLDKQVLDTTQGPEQNFESLGGTVKREEMYETGELKDCDTAKPLIDTLATMGVILRVDDPQSGKDIGRWVPYDAYYNNDKDFHIYVGYDEHDKPVEQTRFDGKFAFYSNGYIQPDTLNAKGEIKLMEAMASAPCSYMSQDNKSNDGTQEFTQNFAAAFSYQGSTARKVDPQGNQIFTPTQIMMNLMWVYPQYDNILKDSIRQSAKHPKKKLVIVHMPEIGQGAFGNPKGSTGLALILAIAANIDKLAGSNIIFQRNSIDGLKIDPVNALYNTLVANWNLVVIAYANKLDKNLKDAFHKFNAFRKLIKERAIAFGCLKADGTYNVPPASQGQQNPQYPKYQPPNPQMQNPMQYRNY